jgi:hypothetical protein
MSVGPARELARLPKAGVDSPVGHAQSVLYHGKEPGAMEKLRLHREVACLIVYRAKSLEIILLSKAQKRIDGTGEFD